MKFNSKVQRIGDGVGVYLPKPIEENFDLESGDEVLIDIVEEEERGDKKNAVLVIFED